MGSSSRTVRSSKTGIDVLIVSYGEIDDLCPLIDSLRAQSTPPDSIRVWHNGPKFDWSFRDRLGPDVSVDFSGENLGYGGALNRLFDRGDAACVVIVNPDVQLEPDCLSTFVNEIEREPTAVVVGGALTARTHDGTTIVNAYGQRLTFDLVGINTDRGQRLDTFFAQPTATAGDAGSRYLGPSGALFAVNRPAWSALGGGPLFVESLFLYLEDVALWLKIRRAGGRILFAAHARGHHGFSASTGRRSALKLYQVERNRLWLLRALWGRAAAAASLPFAGLRMAAYAASEWRPRAVTPTPGQERAPTTALAKTLVKAWRDGLFLPMPRELADYLGMERAPSDLWSYLAPLRAQLRDPTR